MYSIEIFMYVYKKRPREKTEAVAGKPPIKKKVCCAFFLPLPCLQFYAIVTGKIIRIESHAPSTSTKSSEKAPAADLSSIQSSGNVGEVPSSVVLKCRTASDYGESRTP